ncbi:CD27 antigen isoform X2 [Macrotis lagotis]|uniref:CD27 antigen isoform X2 n=1 Tax=Macrotis lagotis TaxID=92651 RepID=UPI003D689311
MTEYPRMESMAPGISWWLWVLGTLVALSPGVISNHHCPQGQYQVEQGSWCCRLCNPGFSIQKCNITSNTKCACPKGQQCQDKECTNCDPQPLYLLSTPQYPIRNPRQPPATIHQHPTNTYSAYYTVKADTRAPTGCARRPEEKASSNQVGIYILFIFCGLILTILIYGTWLNLKQRNCQFKKEQDKKEPVKVCLTGSRTDPGPCCPKQEEGSTVPIQEDYRKPDPASYP